MNFSPKKILSLLGLSVFLFPACSTLKSVNENSVAASQADANQNGEKNNPAAVKDDPEELEKIIKLPFPPEEATWREEATAAPNGKKLTAVVSFSAEDARRILESGRDKSPNAADIDAETWFPAELVAQSQLSGDGNLKGVSFAAADFLEAPYTKGQITHINGTNYFVLELSGE